MTLPKSLRPRNRYVFFEAETLPDASFGEHDLRRALWFEAQNLYGDVTSAETRAKLVEYDGDDATLGAGVVRCDHDGVEETRAALACIDKVQGDPVGIRVVGVSGTLKAGRDRYGGTPETRETTVDGSPAWERGDVVDVRTDDGFMCGTHHDLGKE
ncbi:MAG: ribonuclease P/MRP protein subunit POP5 [Methanobacteriota archaeon]|jgi:ribonuclease P/MRP protein subunit POP5|uniref:Ribonuclease P protein component 2 n=1 Tax=Halorutilus salinus TaxID=2487751 RepID=A0A9Q4C2V6_9EURY|nr:Rpp14/Pop5 family protein [Halorutilus salinus]MCX2817964.1 ribonuclease P [Halorutilus salinus]